MQTLDRLIRDATDAAVDTVVHVGAGRGAVLDTYARLAPSKVLLVEGDPDTARSLQRAAREFRWAQVVSLAAAASDGDVAWNRYNLAMLNGPMAVDALASHYPRLRRESPASVPGVALSALLRSTLPEDGAGACNTLVLDVPGQEATLLESLGSELERITTILVRRCAVELPGSVPWRRVLELMRERGFEPVGKHADDDPLWPVVAFRFDRQRHEAARLHAQADALGARVAALEAEHETALRTMQAMASLRDAQARTIETLKSEAARAERLAAEREAALQEQVAAHERQRERIDSLTAAAAAAEARAAEGDASLQALQQARDEQLARVDALAHRNAALEGLVAERDASLQALEQARAEQLARIEALGLRNAELERFATEHETALRTMQAMASLRDAQARTIETLKSEAARAERLAAEREAALQEQVAAHERQRERIDALTAAAAAAEARVAERDASLQALEQARAEHLARIDALTAAKSTAEAWAADREAAVRMLARIRVEQAMRLESPRRRSAAADAKASSSRAAVPSKSASRAAPASVEADFYRAFEDRFRGSRELIAGRLSVYLPFVRPVARRHADKPVLDLGCGRGEWLEVLQNDGILAQGVDRNAAMLEGCARLGLWVECGDALGRLSRQPDRSCACISLIHVVEHLPFDDVLRVVEQARRVLVPDGLLIMETPNPENYSVGSCNFYMDPTHRNPLPPPLLAFIPEHLGFGRVKVLRLQEPPEARTDRAPGIEDFLTGISPDYAVVAQLGIPGPDAAGADDESRTWEREYGVGLGTLIARERRFR